MANHRPAAETQPRATARAEREHRTRLRVDLELALQNIDRALRNSSKSSGGSRCGHCHAAISTTALGCGQCGFDYLRGGFDYPATRSMWGYRSSVASTPAQRSCRCDDRAVMPDVYVEVIPHDDSDKVSVIVAHTDGTTVTSAIVRDISADACAALLSDLASDTVNAVDVAATWQSMREALR